jgi:tRNA(Phe) wybutosine-synthesizing methylase Tyw3
MKPDKSPQGFYDKDIIPLLNIINKKFETTSSCSGRITLMQGVKKGESKWIYKTHSKASAKKIYDCLQKISPLRFMSEPLIIHIKCFTHENADQVLKMLQSNGFKKSCIISLKNFVIEVNDTGKMETLLTKDLSYEYIKLLVNEANTRLKRTKTNIKKLEKLF